MTVGTARHRFLFLACLGIAATLLGGCNILPESTPLRVFMLPMEPDSVTSTEAVPLPLGLRVRSLQANQMLSGNRIVVVPQANELSVYGGVRWSDPAPVLIRDRLLEAFQQSKALDAVFNEDNRLQPDVELFGILRAFQSEYVQGKPQIRILADLSLTDPGGRELLASRRFEVRQESRGENIEDIVASFGRAADLLSRDVLEWALNEIAPPN